LTSYRGFEGIVKIDDNVVALAQGLTIDIDTGVEAVYVVGKRDPARLKEGQRSYSGSIERLYSDDTLFDKLTTASGTQTEYTISGVVTDGTTTRSLEVKGVKFNAWSWDMPRDDFVTESADFVATGVVYS